MLVGQFSNICRYSSIQNNIFKIKKKLEECKGFRGLKRGASFSVLTTSVCEIKHYLSETMLKNNFCFIDDLVMIDCKWSFTHNSEFNDYFL